ncbi:hypothetical protein [Bacillus wiedmannii]|uniref:hypothetical protein n=1 Tax=Bacillus wiedmannii TaxID=1890302 RepID=UPI000BED1870|nr:hypothetical protein [Bacillus wiedmannii]PEF41687.1 hypothetical protein CON72_07610 [Bacillus wiedmannii]
MDRTQTFINLYILSILILLCNAAFFVTVPEQGIFRDIMSFGTIPFLLGFGLAFIFYKGKLFNIFHKVALLVAAVGLELILFRGSTSFGAIFSIFMSATMMMLLLNSLIYPKETHEKI